VCHIQAILVAYQIYEGFIMRTTELSVGKQGRIVIPASLRHQLAIEPGAQLVAWVEDGRLIMESKQQLWHSIHQACSKIPKETDLAQELINERRASAKKENE
jgi:AbrB family looped-hinge helix DNA binding protein